MFACYQTHSIWNCCACVCVGLRWRNNFIWGPENSICAFVFPLLALLYTWDSSCVNVDYFYLSMFAAAELQPSLSICTQSARLSGSRTAPRGSHVWLSQSCWRATRGGPRESNSASISSSGGDGDCYRVVLIVCVRERMLCWFSQAFLSVCFSSFGSFKRKKMQSLRVRLL